MCVVYEEQLAEPSPGMQKASRGLPTLAFSVRERKICTNVQRKISCCKNDVCVVVVMVGLGSVNVLIFYTVKKYGRQ